MLRSLDNLMRSVQREQMPGPLTQQLPPHIHNARDLFTQHKERDRPYVHFYGRTLTFGEVDLKSISVALFLQTQVKIKKGDRVAICLQNIPDFIIIVLAAWRVGAIVVPVSPMSKEKEMEYILNDSGARVLFVLRGALLNIANKVWPKVRHLSYVFSVSPVEYLPAGAVKQYPELATLIEKEKNQAYPSSLKPTGHLTDLFSYKSPSQYPPEVELDFSDIAFLTYTSGTTGPSKGAMNTHGNVVFNSFTIWNSTKMGQTDIIIALAPLFHITGLICHITSSFISPTPVVLTWQFHPALAARLIENYKVTTTMAASTAFTAFLHDPIAKKANLSSLQKCFSGGAPISPSLIEAVERTYGILLHSAYGMTETTSPSHLVPLGVRALIDPTTNAASVGIPVFNTISKIVGDDGKELPPGEIGEITVKGPHIVPGYWRKEDETKNAFEENGTIKTGDVGMVDKNGWFYIVDRKKDMIIASGYKIWPREVEDEIYKHPKVKEVAVVGVPDSYRGETVKAFVSLKDGESITPEEIIEYCKSRMAAFKYPRQVEIIAEVPKNISGKVLRRELRPKL
eukprot:Phypoly_transcript_01742.p1 GENE.Phypoly_transcript_01742~~Phypoly_transcript_01742.p1  ORF type:complete len:569 (+),score=69.42 Phypoly_transcript_01742:1430-3136(+)